MRYLLDTGIAQEFIGRNAKVVQSVDVARRAGNPIGICTPVAFERSDGPTQHASDVCCNFPFV